MSSLNALESRYFARRGVSAYIADDTSVALRMRYVGTGSVTSVTVVTGTSLATVTTEGTKTYLFATYTTMSALLGAIQQDGIFEARILDVLSTALTTSTLIDGAITISSTGYYDVLSDTSGANFLGYDLSYNRGTPSRGASPVVMKLHRVSLYGVSYTIDLGTSPALKIYERILDLNGNIQTENLIWNSTAVDNSATNFNFINGNGYLTGLDGAELLVLISGSSATGFMNVSGIAE